MVRSNLALATILALAAHTANAAYCTATGDNSQPAWAEAPDWQKDSAQAGVAALLADPELTAADMHARWCEQKVSDGWVYGDVKDPDKKTHHCLVPYDQLPAAQQVKDHLFRGIVLALAGVLEEYEEQPAPEAAAPAAPGAAPTTIPGFVPIKYVGKRETYREGTYGTGLLFERGQTKMVPAAQAKLMLNHPDVYVIGEASGFAPAEAGAATTKEARDGYEAPTEAEENARIDAVQALTTMNRAGMVRYAKTNFNHDLSADTPAPELRRQVLNLLDRFGLPK